MQAPPQGSVLGTYVFNIATDDLEDGIDYDDLTNDTQYEIKEGDLLFLVTGPTNQNTHLLGRFS